MFALSLLMLANRYVCIAFQLVCKHGGGWNGAVFMLVRVGTKKHRQQNR
jgi:hypothetical protein